MDDKRVAFPEIESVAPLSLPDDDSDQVLRLRLE